MIIRTTDTNELVTVELRSWEETQWSPDCFNDLECNFAAEHEFDEEQNTLASKSEVNDLIDWWQHEVDSANADPEYEGDGLCALGKEWTLDVNSEPYID